jgi:hypothetical protein
MSLNDFEYVDEPFYEELSAKGSTFSTFEEGDQELFEISIAKAILRKEEAYRAIDALIDSTGESWFELGEKLERRRTLDLLDSFEEKLVDSEEDAKMVIHVLREMLLNDDKNEQES